MQDQDTSSPQPRRQNEFFRCAPRFLARSTSSGWLGVEERAPTTHRITTPSPASSWQHTEGPRTPGHGAFVNPEYSLREQSSTYLTCQQPQTIVSVHFLSRASAGWRASTTTFEWDQTGSLRGQLFNQLPIYTIETKQPAPFLHFVHQTVTSQGRGKYKIRYQEM